MFVREPDQGGSAAVGGWFAVKDEASGEHRGKVCAVWSQRTNYLRSKEGRSVYLQRKFRRKKSNLEASAAKSVVLANIL